MNTRHAFLFSVCFIFCLSVSSCFGMRNFFWGKKTAPKELNCRKDSYNCCEKFHEGKKLLAQALSQCGLKQPDFYNVAARADACFKKNCVCMFKKENHLSEVERLEKRKEVLALQMSKLIEDAKQKDKEIMEKYSKEKGFSFFEERSRKLKKLLRYKTSEISTLEKSFIDNNSKIAKLQNHEYYAIALWFSAIYSNKNPIGYEILLRSHREARCFFSHLKDSFPELKKGLVEFEGC